MARIFLFVFVLFLLLTVLRGLRIFLQAFLRSSRGSGSQRGARRGGTLEGEMVRDPVCGTWIDRKLALTARRGEEMISVCSEACLRRLEAG
jgi:hypothetical protein